MATTAATGTASLIAFILPSSPESVRIARFHVRAALGFHGLGDYADDAETITSELVTNAIEHAATTARRRSAWRSSRAWRLQPRSRSS